VQKVRFACCRGDRHRRGPFRTVIGTGEAAKSILRKHTSVEIPAPLKYRGLDGRLGYEDGPDVPVGEFIVTETWDGADLEATLGDLTPFMKAVFSDGPLPTRFSGKTAEGLEISLSGFFSPQTSRIEPPYVARYACSGILSVSPAVTATGPVTVKVELINLEFSGNVVNEYALGSDGQVATGNAVVHHTHRRDEIRFTVDGHSMAITQHLNYAQKQTALRDRTMRWQPTASLTVQATSLQAASADILPIVQTVCSLLTLATGTHVDWSVAYFTHADSTVGETRRAAPVRPFVHGPPLMRSDAPEDLCRFIETSYAPFTKWRSPLGLNAVVHAYADGLASGFLDTRTLAFAVLGEYLTTRVLKVQRIEHRLMPRRVGRQVRRLLMCKAGPIIRLGTRFSRLTTEHVDRAVKGVEGKLQWIAEPNLAYKLERVNDHLAAGLLPDDIRAFVKVRNDLAHGMTFDRKRGKPYRQYSAVRYVVDRLLLAILDYRGPFLDCRSPSSMEVVWR
jgi:hypothetical protein